MSNHIEAAVRAELKKLGITVEQDDGGLGDTLARAVNGTPNPNPDDGLAGALGQAIGRPIALNDDQALARIIGGTTTNDHTL